MKCEKCGNDYPSQYYFSTPTICNECFKNLSPEEQEFHKTMMFQVQTQMGEMAARIGFWRRFGAYLLDMAILIIVSLVVMSSTGYLADIVKLGEEAQNMGNDVTGVQELQLEFTETHLNDMLIINVIFLLYFTLEVFIGASLGKLILGYRIGNANRHHATKPLLIKRFIIKNLTIVASILSILINFWLFNVLSGLVGVAFAVSCLVAFGDRRQALHDMMSGTAVYYVEDLISDNQVVQNKIIL